MPTSSSILHLVALSLIKGLGPVTTRNLISWCEGAEAVFRASDHKLMRVPGIGSKTIQLLRNSETLHEAEQVLKRCQKLGIRLLTTTDPTYPKALKPLYDAPVILYSKGAGSLNARPAIAIVGTRKATEAGKEVAEMFAHHFALAGINVVSGMAYGIDITAHKAVLQVHGVTTAVLAHGLETVYPPVHTRHAQEVLEKGNWVSEYAPGSQIDPGNFPARNRIIAGLARATVVVEAAEKGGALITGRFAFDQSREVYAVPGRIGDPNAIGCNLLIRDQIAKLVTSPEEIIQDLGLAPTTDSQKGPSQTHLDIPELNLPLSKKEEVILTCLSGGAVQIDGIALQAGISTSELHASLLSMEFRGLIKQGPGKKFKRL